VRGRPLAAIGVDARDLLGLGGVEEVVEERPEERREEHDLRGDEEDHAVAQAELDDLGVVALDLGLLHHVAPPHEHRVEDERRAGQEQPDRRRLQPDHAGMHVEHRAHRQHEGGDRAHDRPRARIDEVVGMLLFAARHDSICSGCPR
jgi:hypothetical protein